MPRKNKTYWLLIVCTIFFNSGCTSIYFSGGDVTKIWEGRLQTSDEWQRIELKAAVSTTRRFQTIYLKLEFAPDVRQNGFELLAGDGSVFDIKVKVQSQAGTTYQLPSPSILYTGHRMFVGRTSFDVPQNVVIKSFDLRTNHPLTLTEAYLASLNPGDLD